MDRDRRRSIRINASFTVQYCYRNGEARKWDMTSIKDISEVGMCITTHASFKPGELLDFRLKLPSDPFKYINFSGKVVQSQGSSTTRHITRIEFLDLSEEQKEVIRLYVQWFLSRKGQAA